MLAPPVLHKILKVYVTYGERDEVRLRVGIKAFAESNRSPARRI
eukprot:CAMPEP_0172625828 /NCGR_PEP_ID=MMETSP1068-20121228/146060_1 /TAXON_ID=35684 /ORGANISM="Pseudopedinella elastica, Strain CCMP716" /LENGTH=43 /DNA_ID= /DNA_START= /DNA_END= /DNA_ORIENTATION=